jgi:rhodanese-related sulfurtransferase
VRETVGEALRIMAYAGSLAPKNAWELLASDKAAMLVDVRSEAEWAFVGVPDLARLGKRPLLVSWQTYPGMRPNPDFAAQIAKAVPDRDTTLVFLCRSGGRSAAAAEAVTASGYRRCFNLSEGFEGNPDAERHRGRTGGWKAAGLPWTQD